MVVAESGILVSNRFVALFQRAAGGGGTGYSIILMYTYARVPRRAPGWAGRVFEVVAPLARAAQTVRAVHRDTRCSGQTSATLNGYYSCFAGLSHGARNWNIFFRAEP